MIEHEYVTLHSNEGYPIEFHVEYDGDIYHAWVEGDYSTRDFLEKYEPGLLRPYDELTESIPEVKCRNLALVNMWVSKHTYNSLKPFEIDEYGWLSVVPDIWMDD